MLKIINGSIYDPTVDKTGVKETIWVEEGKIIEQPSPEKIKAAKNKGEFEEIDLKGAVVMAGGVDPHSHIAGPKVNTGRILRLDDHLNTSPVLKDGNLRSGVGNTTPTTFLTGYRYLQMGYTTVMEAAGPPLKARHVHEEFADLPYIDKGFLALVGNNYFAMKYIKEGDEKSLKDYLAWLVNATGAYGLKVVNAGRVESWKDNDELRGIDTKAGLFNLAPKEIIKALAKANDELNMPHALHLHTNDLGKAGNIETILATLDLLKDYRVHITHIQFASYGKKDEMLTSASSQLADKINQQDNATVDIGQLVFGDATTMTADSPLEYGLHKLSGNKWASTDVELETGSGVVPMKYSAKNLVNAIQWAIGLELFLKIDNPWQVALTTDHPNAGLFTAYPEIMALLADADYRQEILDQLPAKTAEYTDLADLKREYTLSELAVVTRAAPAKILGLKNKGHLQVGADADLVAYDLDDDDLITSFAQPKLVIKDGKTMVKDGDLIDELITGKTLLTRPEYEQGITEKIREDFEKYYSISLSNYPVSKEYLKEIEVIECR